MGRQVRRVPANWEHPKDERGHYVPLHDGSYSERAAEWDEANEKWSQGLRSDFNGGWKPKEAYETGTFEDWDGERPKPEDYMPDWKDEERTHLQMYEDTTEGTPISPVMDTPENLARWLAGNSASACGSMTATYEQWLAMIKMGWAPTMVGQNGRLYSGVEAAAVVMAERADAAG